MKVPLSWLKDFVEIELSIPELAHRLTLAGLEVEHIQYVGLPLPEPGDGPQAQPLDSNIGGLAWDPELVVVGAILEVMPHPDADRLVLCRLDDGQGEQIVLTGAPNLFPYKGQGPLAEPLKAAYAREGARLYDGHKPGWHEFTLKRARIRGVESSSMVCSEKELGISEEHEGVIILDSDAPVGMPLAEYMGDAVLDIAITPNIARDANILGVAREVAALTGASLQEPDYELSWTGPAIEGRVSIEIREPELNPRFVLGLVEGVQVGQSPYRVQRRLQLAGMRPINSIVDATNYVMLELGEPLHAFDFDVLVERAGGEPPRIITRHPEAGEKLTTLDDVERTLDDFTVLVADTAGALSIAGVMGGLESEVTEGTRRVLLEGAAWNFINIRRTIAAQNLHSEASYRFERGVHPAMAERGVRRCLALMAQTSGGEIARGLVDEYPFPPQAEAVQLRPAQVARALGITLSGPEIADLLRALEFEVELEGEVLSVTPPDHRLDIGSGIIGVADLMEEIARIYGYDRIPETMIADALPPIYRDRDQEIEEQMRDLLASLGLQEVITYRLTTPGREQRMLPSTSPADERPYVRIDNPISAERVVMRHSLLASVLEVVESNARFRERIAVFEIGPVFIASEAGPFPDEQQRLVVALTGPAARQAWDREAAPAMDFFDLKGLLEAFFGALQLPAVTFAPYEHPTLHPGKCAALQLDGQRLGVMGELHPLVRSAYNLPDAPLAAADLDVRVLIPHVPDKFDIEPVKSYPPVLEDLALVLPEDVPASTVAGLIRQTGGSLLAEVRLFDVFRGEQIGSGMKSLAYSLVYQAIDRTLTDEEVAKVRGKIIARLEHELGAKLRS